MAEGPHNFIYNYGAPDYRLPYRRNDDTPLSLPLAPKNLMVTSPYMIGVLDVRWDDPSIYAENNGLDFEGVNVYRAFDAPDAPYEKLNTAPIGVMFYRDQTREVEVVDEDPVAGGRFIAGTNATGDWIVKTYHQPIVIPGTNGKVADGIDSVIIRVKKTSSSDWQVVPAFRVMGETGEIFLIKNKVYNHTTNRLDDPILPDLSRGGEIRVTYTYINNWIQMDINRKIYYRVTSVAVDPDTGESRETPLAETVPVNPYDMERIDWIWAESIRRNRFILEQGGERVKLFIRRWAGQRCSCWDQEYRTGRASCHVCFPPGTLVRAKDGWKVIEAVKAGEHVLSSDGSYQEVLKTMETPYEGDLVSILPSVSTNAILSTPDHPYLVLKGAHRKNGCGPKCDAIIRNGDGLRLEHPNVRQLPNGRWWARAQLGGSREVGRKSLGTYPTRKEAVEVVHKFKLENFKPVHNLVWDPASNIQTGSWLVSSWNKDVLDVDSIRIPTEFVSIGCNQSINKQQEFEVDEEFLWIVGLYLAEGSCAKRSVTFSLHRKETEYRDRITKYFKSKGYGVSTYLTKGNGMSVNVFCSSLAKWFPAWLGRKCDHKHVPNEFMNLPSSKIWALIEGIYAGDGCRGRNEIIQTSEILALQLVELLHRVGEQPLTRRQIAAVLTPKGNKRKVAYCVSWALDSLGRGNRKGRWRFKGELLSSVNKVEKVAYSGKVYNLEVKGNHTYVVNGVVVHNCYGTGYVGGYYGPYDILVAPPETEKIVELMDVGLHVNYDWTTWTGPYPLINDRDFVVRQNNDRYSIAHVNPQGARGAIFQQHFNLAPLDHNDVRYKVPITGGEDGVPPAWNAYRTSRPTDASPTIPEKPEIPDQYELKGRTVTFENLIY